MPTSSNESSRQFRSPNRNYTGGNQPAPTTETAKHTPAKPGGFRVSIGSFSLQIEPRFFIIFGLILPLYTLAAFVGNDWAYMLPCTLFASLVIGILLPLLVVSTISCSCRIPAKNAKMGEQEIILKAWRLPFLGLLSHVIPSGFLNAQLHLTRRTWVGAKKIPAIVPLPVVLQGLSHELEMRLRVPSLNRGVYEAESLEIATCFPFAIAWWSRRIPLSQDNDESCITVLPQLKELIGNFHGRLTSASINAGRTLKNWMLQHRSTSFKGLREFTERDSLNQIHWSSSARAGKFLVREYEVESLPDFDVMLNLDGAWSEQQFDLACTTAYSLLHYGYRMGFRPDLRLNPPMDWEPLMMQLSDIPAGLSGEELAAEILARLTPMPPEIRKEYEQYEQERKRTALDIGSDIRVSSRAVLSVIPAANEKDPHSVVLFEMPKNSDQLNTVADSRSVSALAHVESETELNRI